MKFAASCICICRLCHYWLLNLHWLSKTESKYLYWTRRNTIFVPKPDTLFSSLADLIKTSSRKKTQRSHFREYFVFAFLSESEIEILSRRKWECWNNWPDWFNFKKRNTWPSLFLKLPDCYQNVAKLHFIERQVLTRLLKQRGLIIQLLCALSSPFHSLFKAWPWSLSKEVTITFKV